MIASRDRLLVTIFSDASWDPATKDATWAGWAKSTRDTVRHSGRLQQTMPTTDAAELQAACNALHCALKAGVAKATDKILFQIDNLNAIGLIQHKLKPKHEETIRALWWLEKTRKEFDLVYICKHIKGHTQGGSPREWVHRMCDEAAYKHLRGRSRR